MCSNPDELVASKFSTYRVEGPDIRTLDFDQSAAVQPFVVRSDVLRRYVMVFHVQSWKEHPALYEPVKTAGRLSGSYLTTSSDGVTWRKPCKLFSDRAFSEVGKSISWETGFVQDEERDASGWLVYGYSPSWGSATPHFMVGRRIRLDLSAE